MDPVRSRCMCIRVAAPSDAQVHELLQGVARKEGLALPDEFAKRVVTYANRNMRRRVSAGAGQRPGSGATMHPDMEKELGGKSLAGCDRQ